MSKAESWIVEESEVDPEGRVVRCTTKNLDHVKIMRVEEHITLHETDTKYVYNPFYFIFVTPNVMSEVKLCKPPKPSSSLALAGV